MLLKHKTFLFRDFASDIIWQAESSPKREICGVILGDGSIVQLENVAEESTPGQELFEFGEEYEQYRDRAACIYHSHVGIDVSAELSSADILNAKEQQLPYLVYHPQFRQWDYFDPTALHPYPMEMSVLEPTQIEYYLLWRFNYGRSDCGSLVRAWYAGMLGIDLQDKLRFDWAEAAKHFELERFEELGFELIPKKEGFRTHDVICFDIARGRQNHIGVICSATYNQLLHNLGEGHYSEVVNYGNDWRDRARYVFRHKMLMEATLP